MAEALPVHRALKFQSHASLHLLSHQNERLSAFTDSLSLHTLLDPEHTQGICSRLITALTAL
jgi:hypothetical protein